MPEIRIIKEDTHDGKDGFLIEWMMTGFTESGAKFRANMMTALRFPTTITETKIVGVRKLDPRDYDVLIFVPTEGFPSAGIQNPVKWVREEFGDRFRD